MRYAPQAAVNRQTGFPNVGTGGGGLIVLVPLWILTNGAFGIRGPIGFHQAILASKGDHSRGAALVVAAILGFTAAGTAATAYFLSLGWWPLPMASCLAAALAFLCLAVFPRS